MKLYFRRLNAQFKCPPPLSQLVKRIEDKRRNKRRKLLFIVPSYKDSARLKRLLYDLRKQKIKGFDVLVIYGPNDSFVHVPRLSILHIQRKVNFGFAGAIYLGQLVALQDGYEYFIATDVDKHPFSEKSLQLLVENADLNKADCTYGRCVFIGAYLSYLDRCVRFEKPLDADSWWFLWALIRTDYIQKAGLILLPLYFGSEELEYGYRLFLAGGKHVFVDETIFYTYVAKRGEKFFNLIRNGGKDYTTMYSTLLGLFHFPQIYFRRFYSMYSSDSMVKLKGLLRLFRILLAIELFSVHALIRRMTPLEEYLLRAKNREFGFFIWKGNNEYVKIKKVKKHQVTATMLVESEYIRDKLFSFKLPKIKLTNNFEKIKLLIKALVLRPIPVMHISDVNFIWLSFFDMLYLYDDKERCFYLLKWRNKISRQDMLLTILKMELACFITFFRTLLSCVKDEHLKKYSYAILRE